MAEKIRVQLEPLGKVLITKPGTPLIDLIHEYGVEFPCGGKGTCGSCKVKLLEGNIEMDAFHRESLEKKGLNNTWRLACMSKVTEDITLEIGQFETMILADDTKFDFSPRKGKGIAIDLGTTTIVSQLIELETGKVLDVQTKLNPQSKYGADIMARVSYAVENNGTAELSKMVRETTGTMIELHKKYSLDDLKSIILVGNTVMHHLFCGIQPHSLAMYPFESENITTKTFQPEELNWDLPAGIQTTFLPSIGSFVGSDILAGILSTRIHESEKFIALIDLGTNGEIAVGNKDKIIVASTAAGPAFEGTNIMMGMKATSGAISEIKIENGFLKSHVIGNIDALGICGSGLIDAICLLNQMGEIDNGGQIKDDKRKLNINKDVFISQKDIREFQLAKAAIAAGLDILLKKLNIKHHDLDKLYIAGGFGNFINLNHAIELGMLEVPAEIIKKRGNSALIGAKMMLFKDLHELDNVLNISNHISLEGDINFQDVYVEKMFF